MLKGAAFIGFILCLALSVTACSQRSSINEPVTSQSQSVNETPSTPSEPEAHNEFPVTSNRDVFLDEEQKKYYYDEYMQPYYLTGLFYREWKNVTDIEVYLLVNGYHYSYLMDVTSETTIPAKEVESDIQRHFDVSSDYLRTSERYKSNSNTYVFPPVEGIGAGGGLYIEITEEKNGMLSIYYEDAEAVQYVLTIDIFGQDFKYISNLKLENQGIAEPPEGTVQVSFAAPVLNEMGTVQDETVDFSIYLPKDWTVADLEISEDGRKVAEVLSSRIVYNKSEPFEDADFAYAEAITVRDITAGLYSGKCYHMQTEVTESGVTFFQNDLIYCLNTGDRIILIVFYPSYGIGLGTQNEQFSSYLNTIQLL